ncbi:efflux RND transporter permease subunit, partial [Leptospira interrogans]
TLREELEKGASISDAVYLAGVHSLRPVMTTEVIAAVGFIPMAISTMAGAEVQRPLATVVIFGVIVATVFSRVLLPIVMEYLLNIYEHQERRKSAKRRLLEKRAFGHHQFVHDNSEWLQTHSETQEIVTEEDTSEVDVKKRSQPKKSSKRTKK